MIQREGDLIKNKKFRNLDRGEIYDDISMNATYKSTSLCLLIVNSAPNLFWETVITLKLLQKLALSYT